MKKRQWFLIAGIAMYMLQPVFGQHVKSEPVHPQVDVTHAQYLGKTPPLRNLIPANPSPDEKRQQAKQDKKTVPNFIGRRDHTFEPKAGALPKDGDPVRQAAFGLENELVIEPLVNIDGMDQGIFGGNPPDPCGDIGSNYYIQQQNASFFQVFDKEGNAVSGPVATNTIWNQVGFSSAGDPIILYDQEVDRWIITEFPPQNRLLFAISETSDPMGSWDAYAFQTPSFPDYPKYSIWSNAYCVTTNEGGAGMVEAYFINRQEMLSGAASPTIQRITLPGVSGGPGFYVATPVDWTGANEPPADALPMILCLRDDAWASASQDGIEVFEVDIDWATPANTTYTSAFVPSQPFDTNPCAVSGPGFACIPQLNGGGIDGIPEVIMHQVHYRNFGAYEVMVLNFIVDATAGENVSGIRWMELRRTGSDPWTVFQEGTYAPNDGLHRFMGGIAMDGNGNIGLAYSVSSESTYAGLRFTGRRASDPPGVMTVQEVEITEGFSANPGSRYGDYAQMVVDPVNDRTFWYTGEYRKAGGWGTKIFAFELTRDTNDIGPINLLAPLDSPDLTDSEIVTIEVKNFGLDTQTVFQVGYIFENGAAVTEEVTTVLPPDSVYVHTFSPAVDMSAVGPYEFKLFSSLATDQAIFNDTLRLVRVKQPRFDAGISNIANLDGVGCADTLVATLTLVNYGTETLESVDITVTLNGGAFTTISWTGVLLPGESETVNVQLYDLVNGENEILASTSNPNGMADEAPANDQFSRFFDVILDGAVVVLALTTDNYPEETTWEVTDVDGTVLYAGGPFDEGGTLYSIEMCLDPDSCYTFTIFDSYGDGICCNWGQGSYTLLDAFGNELLTGNPDFDFSLSSNFCATFDCILTADINLSPESADGAADGAILITPGDGVGPFQYSIDGGATFQSSPLFEGLAAGEYAIVVTGAFDCLYEETVVIELCALAFNIEITNESADNAGDGEIQITVSSGNPPYQYSIDGGATFQSSPLFENLFKGEYEVVVKDAIGCETTTAVEVGVEPNSTRDLYVGYAIEVLPNPTDGLFRINVKGLQRKGPFLEIQIHDASGRVVQFSSLVKYGDVFTGELSLYAYPAGVYYVRFMDEQMERMARVVKN
jgi:hypothetical protein